MYNMYVLWIYIYNNINNTKSQQQEWRKKQCTDIQKYNR